MQLASISDPRLWDLLCLIDEREASRVRCAGCRHCGGALHSATYARKPRGVSEAVVSGGPRPVLRHSFCCAVCRRRTTPASVRFWGRRVYVGLIVLLLPVLLGDGSPTAVSAACGRLGLSRQTLRRWRRWWQETFAAGCRGVGAPARSAGRVPQRRVAGAGGSGAVVPSGWLLVRGFRGRCCAGPGPAEDASLMIGGG